MLPVITSSVIVKIWYLLLKILMSTNNKKGMEYKYNTATHINIYHTVSDNAVQSNTNCI